MIIMRPTYFLKALFFLAITNLTFADTFTVSNTNNDSTVDSGSLGGALNSAGNTPARADISDTLTFSAILFNIPQTITLDSLYPGVPKNAGSSLTMIPPAPLTIDGQGFSVFNFSGGGTFNIGNMVLKGTNAVNIANSTINATNCLFSSGINFNNGTLQTTTDTLISGPVSLVGEGGIDVKGSTTTTVIGRITGAGPFSVTNSGTLISANPLKSNNYSGGTLITGATVSINDDRQLGNAGGGITLDEGTLQTTTGINSNRTIVMKAGGGTFDVSAGQVTTLKGMISDVGSFTKSGDGTLTLTGANTYSGPTAVTQGKMLISGSLQSPVKVSQGALLAGTGIINNTVINSGTLFPGDGITPLTINGGSYTQTTTGIFNVAITPTTASSLDVVGTVVLGSNATLQLTPSAGSYSTGTVYTIISATGGITGTFAKPTVMNSNLGSHLAPAILYDQFFNMISIILEPPTGPPTPTADPPWLIGQDATTQAVANYFKNRSAVPLDLVSALDKLNGQPLEKALHDISLQEIFANNASLANATSALINGIGSVRLNALRDSTNRESTPQNFLPSPRLHSLRATNPLKMPVTHAGMMRELASQMQQDLDLQQGKSGLWFHTFGQIARQKPHQNDRGINIETGGIIGGIDGQVKESIFVGGGIGYSSTLLKWDDKGGNTKVKSPFFIFYGTFYKNAFSIDGSLTCAYNSYGVSRRLAFADIDRTTTSNHKGFSLAPHVGFSLESKFQEVTFRPFLSFDCIYVNEKKYTSTGGQSLNALVKLRDSFLLRSEEGVNFSKSFISEDVMWVPNVKLSYINKNCIKQSTMEVGLVDMGGNFTITNPGRSSNEISPGFGVTAHFKSGLYVNIRYDAELAKNYKAHEVNLKMGYTF
jgi:autotransporter-associated beta strand protein